MRRPRSRPWHEPGIRALDGQCRIGCAVLMHAVQHPSLFEDWWSVG